MDRLRIPIGYREPLSAAARLGLISLVLVLHAGAVTALTSLPSGKILIGDVRSMEVRFELTPPPQPELSLPDPSPMEAFAETSRPQPPQLELAPAPLPSGPEASEFLTPAPRPPQPRPPAPKPRQVAAQQAPPAVPSEPKPEGMPGERTTGHRMVKQSDLVIVEPIKLTYPARSLAAQHWGAAVLRVLIDVEGRPSEVWLTITTTHSELDNEAVRAIKAARFKPYAKGGEPEAVWVDILAMFALIQK